MASITALGIGSGLDLSGLLEQLEAAERQQLTPIVEQQESYQAKISAFGQLESALDSLRSAAAALNEAKAYTGVTTSLNTEESLSATADDSAVVGTYNIEVTQLATSYSIALNGVADKEEKFGAGTLKFTFAGDPDPIDPPTVDITESESSLEGIRDAINAADIGVVASIINDGHENPYRLVLTSVETGTDAAFTVDLGSLSSSLSQDDNTKVEAKDAKLKINGIEITSQSNRVEEAIQGVTLDLEDTGETTLKIDLDTASIENKIKNFVSAYNYLENSLSSLTSYDQSTGTAGILIGNSTVQRIESRMRNVLTDALEGGAFKSLLDLGITLEVDGTLTLDEGALSELIETRLDDLSSFFAGGAEGIDGLSDRVDAALGEILDEGGILDNAVEGLESSIDFLQERYESTEARIENTMEIYRAQFAQLDSLIAQMNSTSAYLTQQFDILNAQLSQSKSN